MKRYILSLLTMVLCAVIAFAQSETETFPTSVTFTSPDGVLQYDEETEMPYLLLSQMTATIIITPNQVPDVEGVQPVVVMSSGVQYGFTPSERSVELGTIRDNHIVLSLDKSVWGRPIYNNYYLTLTLCYMDDEENVIERDGEPISFMMLCVTQNYNPAEFVYAIPDGTSSGNDRFADAYRKGIMTVAFNNAIHSDDEEIGMITYFTTSGEVIYEYISEYLSNWNKLDYYWALRFNIANSDFTADDLEKIVVDLYGVKTYNSIGESVDVNVPTIILNNDSFSVQSYRNKQSRMTENLIESDAPITIYNIQGMAVKENVDKSSLNDLPAGLYIINGKKVIVK